MAKISKKGKAKAGRRPSKKIGLFARIKFKFGSKKSAKKNEIKAMGKGRK